MPNYLVYGLYLHSNQDIPGLVANPELEDSPADVNVWLGYQPPWLNQFSQGDCHQEKWYVSNYQDDNGEPGLRIWQLHQGAYFRILYSDGTEFFVDAHGTQIWATWSDSLTVEDTATYLLGPVLGWLLRLRGIVCLHASAVVVEGKVVAFVGEAGAGKSTTAAAFAQAGYPILSDDIVALVEKDNTFTVQPAYPRIRLWSESVSALYGNLEALPKIVPTNSDWDKRYLDLSQNGYQFQQKPLPLAGIYFLNERNPNKDFAPCVEAIANHTGLINLVANTYGNYLLDQGMRSQEFKFLGRLISKISLRQVTPHTDIAYLSNLVEVILKDFQSIRQGNLSQL